MGYSVGDKVEVKAPIRKMINGVLSEYMWQLWLIKIVPRNNKLKFFRENPNAIFWESKFTRASHHTVIEESWITKKISSNFEGFFPEEK